jgi:hypothetical protein
VKEKGKGKGKEKGKEECRAGNSPLCLFRYQGIGTASETLRWGGSVQASRSPLADLRTGKSGGLFTYLVDQDHRMGRVSGEAAPKVALTYCSHCWSMVEWGDTERRSIACNLTRSLQLRILTRTKVTLRSRFRWQCSAGQPRQAHDLALGRLLDPTIGPNV